MGDAEKHILQGTYPLEKLFELFNMKKEEERLSNTVSSFIMEQFEHMPQNNDLLYYKDLKIIVVNAREQRVVEVIVGKITTEDDKANEETK